MGYNLVMRFDQRGTRTERIIHRRGVQQGDPLSPLIFLLAMEPLHLLFRYAYNSGALSFLHDNCASFRISLYADDTAVFIKPLFRT
jgi:hypothetical protein